MKFIFLFLFLSSSLFSELVDVTFTASSSGGAFNSLDFVLSAPGAGSSSNAPGSQVAGTVVARLNVDPDTGAVSSIRWLSSQLQGSPSSFQQGPFNLQTTTLEMDIESFAQTVSLTSLNLGANGVATGSSANLHDLVINGGVVTGSVGNSSVNENFATDPIDARNVSPAGATNLSMISARDTEASDELTDVFDVTLNTVFEATQVFVLVTNSGSVNVSASYDLIFNATARVVIDEDNPYLIWAADNGVPNTPFNDDVNLDGLSNGLAWALGYNGSERVEVLSTQGTTLTVVPGGDGIQAPVSIQSSVNLNGSSTGFINVPSSSANGSVNPLSVGRTSQVTVGGLSGDTRFFRLSVQEP